LSSSAAYLPSLVIGKASVGSRLAAMRRRGRRRRLVTGAGSDHGNDGSNSESSELHDERL
jgi:hypothetical protein